MITFIKMSITKHLLFTVTLVFNISVQAQDTIYKRAGDIIPVKILEIGIKKLSYKRLDLLDGPLFVINKNEILKIKYATGLIDSFRIFVDAPEKPLIVLTNPSYLPQFSNEIQHSIRRGVYRYQGNSLSDRDLLFMAYEKNQIWKNSEIDFNIKESKRSKSLQYAIGYGGAAFGGVSLYATAMASSFNSNSNDAAVVFFAGIISAGVVISSQIISFQYKLTRVKHADKVVELYNQLSKN
jgi:hypothetical protein